tara:strand:+ start:1649 stop:1864 length:216 start_codon:yes stop_codon:yes gene_type:complete
MGRHNIVYKDNMAFEILTEIGAHNFQNKDGSINQQVLGMYVNDWSGDRVLQREGKFLICKTIEEAQYEELG